MRRGIGYVSAWVAATSCAAAGAWFGSTIVLHRDGQQAAVSAADELQQPIGDLASPLADQLGAGAPAQAPSGQGSGGGQVGSPASTGPADTSGSAAVTTPPDDSSATINGQAPTANPTPSQSGHVDAAGRGLQRTVQTDGGDVTATFRPDQITEVRGLAADGYHFTWSFVEDDPTVVKAVFSSLDDEYDVYLTWTTGPIAHTFRLTRS